MNALAMRRPFFDRADVNVKQAANVLDLIEFFAQHKRPAALAEIAKHFDWPRS